MGFSVIGSFIGQTAQMVNSVVTNAKLANDIAIGGTTWALFIKPSSIGQGTWTPVVYAAQMLDYFFRNTSNANGDNFTMNVYLSAGTYTFQLLTHRATDKAIVDVDIDGVEVASYDLYNGGEIVNHVFETANIVVSTTGLKAIRFRVDGRNAASTQWYFTPTAFAFIRTA